MAKKKPDIETLIAGLGLEIRQNTNQTADLATKMEKLEILAPLAETIKVVAPALALMVRSVKPAVISLVSAAMLQAVNVYFNKQSAENTQVSATAAIATQTSAKATNKEVRKTKAIIENRLPQKKNTGFFGGLGGN